ncbi:MAG: hypothetical protein EXQ95_13460 [Alphaproteobacteria bacterium]|nr:hypothetical protein [Alphaproteobacteria bacterium]
MTAEAVFATHTFRVGKRVAKITVQRPKTSDVTAMVVEWSPSPPRRLSGSELEQYRAGRAVVIAELGKAIGGNVLVVDL